MGSPDLLSEVGDAVHAAVDDRVEFACGRNLAQKFGFGGAEQLDAAVDADPEPVSGCVSQFHLLHQPDFALRSLDNLERQSVESRRDAPVLIVLRSSGCKIKGVGAAFRSEPEALLAAYGVEMREGGFRCDQRAVDPSETRAPFAAGRGGHHPSLPLGDDADSCPGGCFVGELKGLDLTGF